jgi:hypothetical protein
MKLHIVSLTISDIEDAIYAVKAYCNENRYHPGLSARQRWHRLSNTLAKLELARDIALSEPRESLDPRPPTVEG